MLKWATFEIRLCRTLEIVRDFRTRRDPGHSAVGSGLAAYACGSVVALALLSRHGVPLKRIFVFVADDAQLAIYRKALGPACKLRRSARKLPC